MGDGAQCNLHFDAIKKSKSVTTAVVLLMPQGLQLQTGVKYRFQVIKLIVKCEL